MTLMVAMALLVVVGAVNLRYEPTIAERMATFKASEGRGAQACPQARVVAQPVNGDGSAGKKACMGRAQAPKGSELWCKCNIDKAVIGANVVTGSTRCVDVGGGRAGVCTWDAAAKVCVPSKTSTSTTTTVHITIFTTSPAPVPDGRGNANAKKCALCAYWDVLSAKCEANKGEGGTPKMCAFALACKKLNADRPRPCRGDVPPTTVGTTVGTTSTTSTTTTTSSSTGTITTTGTTTTTPGVCSTATKVECGHFGTRLVGQQGKRKVECESKGCCWDHSPGENSVTPWCYTRGRPKDPTCQAVAIKRDCKRHNLQDCEAAGCCWEVSPKNNKDPWCFKKTTTADTPPPSTPTESKM